MTHHLDESAFASGYRPSVEASCLAILHTVPGLEGITGVRIVPEAASLFEDHWQILAVEPAADAATMARARGAVADWQRKFGLA